eukprot:COSAG01_NODE_25_length_37050_cov_211.559119_23_plen_95_part_00
MANKKRAGVPLCFRTAKEQQERALKNEAGKRLCEVRGCRKVLSASELAVVAKVQNKSDHRYKGNRFYKAGFEHGPFTPMYGVMVPSHDLGSCGY